MKNIKNNNIYLRYNNIGQILGADVQLFGLLELNGVLVVLQIVLDAVVDIRDLADVERFVFRVKVLLDFAPAAVHQVPRLPMVENRLYNQSRFTPCTQTAPIHYQKPQQANQPLVLPSSFFTCTISISDLISSCTCLQHL